MGCALSISDESKLNCRVVPIVTNSSRAQDQLSDRRVYRVEEFLLKVYEHQNSDENLRLILASTTAKKALKDFLIYELAEYADLVSEIRSRDMSSEQDAEECVIAMLALCEFSKFLKSPMYSSWRAQENASLFETTAIAVTQSILESNASTVKETSKMSVAENTFAVMENPELEKLFKSSTWLSSLLASVENIPLCFCLASADSTRRGFPLIYVNKEFERQTGYMRSDAIGRNCSFLQGEGTDKIMIAKLTNSLANYNAITINLVNYRKDGSKFENHLCLKPIFDQNNVCRYFVGLQFDLATSNNPLDQIQLNDRLMSIIPDGIVVY